MEWSQTEKKTEYLEVPETRNTGDKSCYLLNYPRNPQYQDPRLHMWDGKKRPQAPSRPKAQRSRSGATRLGHCMKRTPLK